MILFSVERYDPRTNRWNPVSPMGTRRKHLGVAVYNNMIYAVGGRDDTTELSSAERYNPQTNTWQPVVAMTSRRSGVSILIISYLPSLFKNFASINQWNPRSTLIDKFCKIIFKSYLKLSAKIRLKKNHNFFRFFIVLSLLGITWRCIWWVWITPSLPSLPGPLWPRVVVPVRVPSMGQKDLFRNNSYSIGPCAKKNE